MFSFPLFERLKAEAPEFEQLTAFQAGGVRVSVRRPGRGRRRALAPRRNTSPATTSRRFGVGAFGGRVFTADDDTPASPPVVVLSHHVVARRSTAAITSLVGADARHRGPSVHGRRRRAAGLLRRDAAQRSARPLDSAAAGAADHRRQLAAAPADLRLAARDRPAAPGATIDGIGAAAHRTSCASGCSTTRASRRTGCPTSTACCRSRRSRSCPPAPASA